MPILILSTQDIKTLARDTFCLPLDAEIQTPQDSRPREVMQELVANNKLNAIKILREMFNIGLKEGKEIADILDKARNKF